VPRRRSERRNGAGPRGTRGNGKGERFRGDEGQRRVPLRVVHPPSKPFKSLFPLHLGPGSPGPFFSADLRLPQLSPDFVEEPHCRAPHGGREVRVAERHLDALVPEQLFVRDAQQRARWKLDDDGT